MLRRIISAIGAGSLVLAAVPALAAPPDPAQGEPPEAAQADDPETAEDTVDRAIEAWRQGDWTEVRSLLEPLVGANDLEAPFLNESALRYLAEATLLDTGLEEDQATILAEAYIGRLLERDPQWAAPSGLHGGKFKDAVIRVRSRRDTDRAEVCQGQLLACEADYAELKVDYEAARAKIRGLQDDLATDAIFMTELIRRNRGIALLPFGIGHFLNGTEGPGSGLNKALGGSFLALELSSGVAALSLLVYRNTAYGCVRTDGFNFNSLDCADVPDDQVETRRSAVEDLRTAETTLAWIFVGSVILDLTLAQVLFKPVEVIGRGERTRQELAEELEGEKGKTQPQPGPSASRSPSSPNVRLRLSPHPTFVPGGFGFGATLQF